MLRVIWMVSALTTFALLTAGAQTKSSALLASLAAMRDRSRPLLIFNSATKPGEKAQETFVQRQLTLLDGHRAELNERDVAFILVPDGSAIGGHGTSGDWLSLRHQFHVHSDRFTVILVGKDGGEKFRSHVPVTIEMLDSIIDAMPMRQQEVRDGNSK